LLGLDRSTPTAATGAFTITANVGIVSQPVTMYVANTSANTVTAYDDQGARQTLSGTFPNLTLPFGIAVEP
jgi:hypothetical protein